MEATLRTSMVFERTRAAYDGGARVIANRGGTRSGKTYSTLTLLLTIAFARKLLISVVSESFPHLRRGALRDFDDLLERAGFVPNVDYRRNITEGTYTFNSGGIIEFFSVDNDSKVHGSQRDILFVNECNHIKFETYRQLAIRTAKTIFIDWNPTTRFWYEEQGIANRPDTTLIVSTYKDNPFLSAEQVAEIESYKGNSEWWKVYGLGEIGSVEGIIYTDWEMVTAMPQGGRKFYGIDFGYTIDPTAIVEVVYMDGELWINELCYRRGMSNADIAEELRANGLNQSSIITADSAEPKSIDELRRHRFAVRPSVKGADSVAYGIQQLQRFKMHVTANSVGLISELRAYSWERDKSGVFTARPVGADHALDALRYAVTDNVIHNTNPSAPKINITTLY